MSILMFVLVKSTQSDKVVKNVFNLLRWIFANLEAILWDWLCGWTSLRQWTIGCLTKLSFCIMNLVLWLITNNLPCVSCLDLEAQIVTYMLSMANNRQPFIRFESVKTEWFKNFETWTYYWYTKLEPIIRLIMFASNGIQSCLKWLIDVLILLQMWCSLNTFLHEFTLDQVKGIHDQ